MTWWLFSLVLRLLATAGAVALAWRQRRLGEGMLVVLLGCLVLEEILVGPGVGAPAGLGRLLVGVAGVALVWGLAVSTQEAPPAPPSAPPVEEKLARVFHVSPDAVTLSSVADGRFREVNEGFRRVTGYEREEVLGRTSGDLALWVDPQDRVRLLERLEESGRVVGYDVRFRHKSGRHIDCQVAAEIVELEKEPNLLFLVRDVSHLARARAQQREMVAEIESATVRLERFYSTLAHELRSPLVTIRGFLGLLDKDLEAGDSERVARDMERIAIATEQMHRSLDDLLELANLGRRLNRRAEVDLDALAQEVARDVEERFVNLGAEIRIDPGLPTVEGDPERLHELFRHLLENAVVHGASTEGESSWGDGTQVVVGTREGEHGLEVTVRDDGPGVDPRYLERIFDLFERLDPGHEGTGLGLPLARRIAELHGGWLWVESEGDGTGSTFVFSLAGPPVSPHRVPVADDPR